MNQKEFWELIDEVNQEAKPWDKDSILIGTQKKLLELPAQEIIDFHNLLKLYMELADTPCLTAAAIAINDGVSDDSFTDFRAWLVSQGRDIYQKALKCADSLAEVDIPSEPYSTIFEFYGYIGSYAYRAKCLLEHKGIQEMDVNEYFALKPKGAELVKHILEYSCAYDDPYANSNDSIIKGLYVMLHNELGSYNVYDAAVVRPLSKQQEKKIRSELEFEPSPGRKRRWTAAELQKVVPELYSRYQEHSYTMVGM